MGSDVEGASWRLDVVADKAFHGAPRPQSKWDIYPKSLAHCQRGVNVCARAKTHLVAGSAA